MSVSYSEGLIYLTYEPVTNVSQHLTSDSNQMHRFDESMKKIAEMVQDEQQEFAWQIADGAVKFYPFLTRENMDFVKIRSGVVRNRGRLTTTQESSHHQRTESGIFVAKQCCIIRDEAIKIPNGVTNALKLEDAVKRAMAALKKEREAQEFMTRIIVILTFCIGFNVRNQPDVCERLHRKQRRVFFRVLNENLQNPSGAP